MHDDARRWRYHGLVRHLVLHDGSRFGRSSSAGTYLGLTPRRYESDETSRNGRISKQGSVMTRKHIYEAATTLKAGRRWPNC
ncbi:transposase [Aliihoeflea sp. 40Bstr573]|uniref:transposase n=1 Tax=Aliihoeflea sp. 40Bstr573 TaxID=2696467 RepID=UPI003531A008